MTPTPLEDSDYYPYGGEIPLIPNDPNTYKFTGKERDSESGLDNFMKRYYGSSLGRFQTPDPLVLQRLPARAFLAHVSNPQSWNKYAYVMNNPLSLTDPTGLDFYLTCTSTKNNASTCQDGHVGTTDDKGKFTATVITSAQLQDPKSGVTGTVTGGGVQITTASGTYGAQFINGTPAATLQGSGALANFTFNITGQNPGNMLRGSWRFNGTPEQAQQWMKSHGAWSYGPFDVINPFHPNTQQFRFSDPNDPSGPSMHISQPLGSGLGIVNGFQIGVVTFPSESQGAFHEDTHGTIGGHIQDVIDVLTK
jgi:RHS repeat-associated protein